MPGSLNGATAVTDHEIGFASTYSKRTGDRRKSEAILLPLATRSQIAILILKIGLHVSVVREYRSLRQR